MLTFDEFTKQGIIKSRQRMNDRIQASAFQNFPIWALNLRASSHHNGVSRLKKVNKKLQIVAIKEDIKRELFRRKDIKSSDESRQ